MKKYEIMLVVNGKLDQDAAKKVADQLKEVITKAKDIKETNLGLKKMAYSINGIDEAYYFQYNFETDIPLIIEEYRRLALINTNVLRHLIINIENDYGYRATNNPKKVKDSEKKLKIYFEKRAKAEAEFKARKLAKEAAVNE